MKRNHNRLLPLLFAMALTGCGIPASMHVRMGSEPRYQDDDVLFRATYYFRVFDACDDGQNASGTKRIQSDSLYRFKMTGKAKSMANHVRFESGTLQAWQIDPLGASVEFDKETGKPYFVSQQKREETLKQNRLYTEVDRLKGLAGQLGCKDIPASDHCVVIKDKITENLRLIGPGGSSNLAYWVKQEAIQLLKSAESRITAIAGDDSKKLVTDSSNALKESREAISTASDALNMRVILTKTQALAKDLASNEKVKLYTTAPPGQKDVDDDDKARMTELANALGTLHARLTSPEAASSPVSVSDKALICGDGRPARRGFQILGPEGWRTFDQDERLVLAMSGSGRPLLDALRDVSNRAMAQKTQGLAKESALAGYLAVAQARAKLAEVDKAKSDELGTALDAVVEAFNKQGGN